jgi:hypothetical protein
MLTVVLDLPTAAVRRFAAALPDGWASGRGRPTRCADVIRLAILLSAALFLATGDGSAALKALLVAAPSFLARLLRVNPTLDLVFALALGLEAVFGTSALPWAGRGDTLPHIVLPLLSGPVMYAGLNRVRALPTISGRPTASAFVAAATVTAAAVVALGAAWELIEWAADTCLATDYSQGARDTVGDLTNDSIGAAGGGTLVGLWLWAAGRWELAPIASPSVPIDRPTRGRSRV